MTTGFVAGRPFSGDDSPDELEKRKESNLTEDYSVLRMYLDTGLGNPGSQPEEGITSAFYEVFDWNAVKRRVTFLSRLFY